MSIKKISLNSVVLSLVGICGMSSAAFKADASDQGCFDNLPTEMKAEIMGYLPHKDLLTMRLVSSECHNILNDERFWKGMAEKILGQEVINFSERYSATFKRLSGAEKWRTLLDPNSNAKIRGELRTKKMDSLREESHEHEMMQRTGEIPRTEKFKASSEIEKFDPVITKLKGAKKD
ncbi:MAG: F-box protein [Candidatus Paracaedimonas acanthamoebae]|uniref:F-box protein n=1 Tax=Candidatus Paracaedimonas acanthamoebae TaxID=244581 RepID=A0A8J7PJC8_9PROT|nr:F-box protein [Candidatus Paracaedimonas acanthamoebae]